MDKEYIAIIMQSPDIGGAEVYMHSLVTQFIDKGHKITFATNNQKLISLFPKRLVKTDTIPYLIDIIGNWKGLVKAILWLPFSINYYIHLLKKYQQEGVKVILMSNFGEKMLVTFLSQFFSIPVVWIEYGPLSSFLQNNFGIPKVIYISLKHIPKSIIVPSENTKKSLIKDARVLQRNIKVIPCGTVMVKGNKENKQISHRTTKRFVIGNISRMTREKGQQFIIQAAPLILAKIPHAYFLLIGQGPDKLYFESLIKKEGLEKYFLLPGFVNSLDEYFLMMDVFIFPTIWDMEGFGVVVIEAMGKGIPVVASNIGPVPEIVDNGKTGLLFTPGDSKDLAKKVIRLAKNSRYRKELGRQAQIEAEKEYNIVEISNSILAVLKNAAN